MAFKDITKVLYDGKIKLDYKDKAHRYYARPRIDWDRSEDDPKAWGKVMYPKGTTTLIGDTLEKKGLMTWPLGLAIRELFGFYDFTNDQGNRMTGFSKDMGTMWNDDKLIAGDKESLLPVIKSANTAWNRKQQKGADIGSIVHDAIDHFINNKEFDIAENYAWSIKEAEYENDAAREKALAEFDDDIAMATKAFLQFQKWWLTVTPRLNGSEDILYSLEHNICGTYDGDICVEASKHPMGSAFNKPMIRVVADWKTSNASSSEAAAAPEGVYYNYFIQDAIYEIMRREMGMEPADDLVVVSCRKDGGFSIIYASELGLTVDDCIDWAMSVVKCYRFAEKTKAGLRAHAEQSNVGIIESKEDF